MDDYIQIKSTENLQNNALFHVATPESKLLKPLNIKRSEPDMLKRSYKPAYLHPGLNYVASEPLLPSASLGQLRLAYGMIKEPKKINYGQ